MKNYYFFVMFLITTFCFLTACQKTDHPLGLNAPNGFDVPTASPTPVTGAIQVYVFDSGLPVQSVNIALVDPIGNTSAVRSTQPGVGFAAFNPPSLINGIWTARVPTQAVSYVLNPNTSPTTIYRYYGNSSVPITVTGGGSYAVSFTTGGNTVQVAPVSQFWTLSYPVNLPVTAIYYENGNLDVPVSVSISGIPNVTGINAQNPISFVLGLGVTMAPVTIAKNTCYAKDMSLALTAHDFVGIVVPTVGGVIGHSYPVSIIFTGSQNNATPYDHFIYRLDTTNDCGITWTYQCQSTHTSTTYGSGTITSGQSVTITDPAVSTDNLNFTINSSIGSFNVNANLFNFPTASTVIKTFAVY